MTTQTDVVNRALQVLGTRTTVTDAELAGNTTNESIQANLVLTKYRDQLLRMAPWNCAVAYLNLVYITSQPGTPENTSPNTAFWTPGQPPLSWMYEYLYPDDCLRACWLIPSMITGYAGGVPIYPVPTSVGTSPSSYDGPAVRFKVQTDQYFRQSSGVPTIVNGGVGFTVGDTLICGGIPSVLGDVPAGLVNLNVDTVAGGVITGVSLKAFPNLNKTSLLFATPAYNLNQVSSSGLGTGAIVTAPGVSNAAFQARVILTNQEFATLAYCKQVTDPNVMDDDFVEAWANYLATALSNPLTGDKQILNQCIARANSKIEEARKVDGNEGLTINDVTPDFIRTRGINYWGGANWNGFDWGDTLPYF